MVRTIARRAHSSVCVCPLVLLQSEHCAVVDRGCCDGVHVTRVRFVVVAHRPNAAAARQLARTNAEGRDMIESREAPTYAPTL